MCVLYVSFGSKVRPRTFGCVAMCSAVLFILRSRLLVYSIGSGVNSMQVVLCVCSTPGASKDSLNRQSWRVPHGNGLPPVCPIPWRSARSGRTPYGGGTAHYHSTPECCQGQSLRLTHR